MCERQKSNLWHPPKRNVTKPYPQGWGFVFYRLVGYTLAIPRYSRPATALTFDISFGDRIRQVDYGWERQEAAYSSCP